MLHNSTTDLDIRGKIYLQILDMCLVCIRRIVEHNCQLGHVEKHIVLWMAFEWLTKNKDVTTGMTGTSAVTPKFSNSNQRGKILPNIAEVAIKISPAIHLFLTGHSCPS